MTETSRTSEFTVYFQRSVLHRILMDSKFAAEAKRILCQNHFDTDSLRWIFRKILNGITTLPTLICEIKEEQKRERINDDLRKAVVSEIKVFANSDRKVFDDAEYGLSKLKLFIDTQELSEGLYVAASKLKEGGDIERIKGNLRRVVSKAIDETTSTVNLLSEVDNRFKERERKVKNKELIFVPTGIKALDDEIKGPMPGQLWSFFGDTNVGKSALAVSIGCACLIHNFMTWHVGIEDQEEVTTQRYDTSLSKVMYDRLTFCDYTAKEKSRIKEVFDILIKKRKDRIFVSKIEEGCTMDDIHMEYDRLQSVHGFKPTAVLIDSPHCMEPAVRKETTRLNYKQIYIEIRKFIRQEKLATFLFDQSKQDVKDKIADTGASSESYDKARIVDGFITINQTKVQKHEGLLQFYIAKMKDRRKGMSYMVRPTLGVMRFESVIG